MNAEPVFEDDQLDSEWAQYVASLQQDDESRRNREKKDLVQRDAMTMNNLQRHIRGLSRARFVLTDAINSDLFDDSCTSSSSDDDGTSISPQTVRILPTPLAEHSLPDLDLDEDESDKESSFDPDDDRSSSDSDSDGVAPLPTHSSISLHHSLSPLSRNNSRHIRSSAAPSSPTTPLSRLLEKQLSIAGAFDPQKECIGMEPMIDDRDSEDYMEGVDSDEDEVNDSHSLLSANGSRDSQYECSEDEELDSKSSKLSSCPTDSSRKSEDEMPELHYDEELEALRRELNAFKRKNRASRRTKYVTDLYTVCRH